MVLIGLVLQNLLVFVIAFPYQQEQDCIDIIEDGDEIMYHSKQKCNGLQIIKCFIG